MPEYTRKGIRYPVAADLIKSPSVEAKLAADLQTLATTADSAISAEKVSTLSQAATHAEGVADRAYGQAVAEADRLDGAIYTGVDNRLNQLERAAGFPNDPQQVNDTIIAALIQQVSSLTQIALDDRYARANTVNDDTYPTVSIKQKLYNTIEYRAITVHAGGSPRPGLLRKYMDVRSTGVERFAASKLDIETARDNSGSTLIINASGHNNIAGEDGDGALCNPRGAYIIDGQAMQDFPTDDHWTHQEAVGVDAEGVLHGFSKVRGQSVTDMINSGIVNTISSFGPILVEAGAARDLTDPYWDAGVVIQSSMNAIGQKPNGDIVIITGPGKSGTSGGYLADNAQILIDEGCTFGFGLDRGGSTQCFAGPTPLVLSTDAGGKRLIADYISIKLPIGSPVVSQEITLPLSSDVVAVAGYVPKYRVNFDGSTTVTGRVARADGDRFTKNTDVGVMEPLARSPRTVGGVIAGQGDSSRRWITVGGNLRILGSATGTPTDYVTLDTVTWQKN